ncbi:MAG: hypothetical protein AABO58_09620 [Acidobacteriota bacterium]
MIPSVVFVKVLALFTWLFGAVPSVALLLNLFAYLGTALLISWWAGRHGVQPGITAIPVATISYLPSWVLWSLQPMKDAFFCFLVVLFAFCIDEFREGWSQAGSRTRRIARLVAIAVLIAVTTYAIAGVRWYYAIIGLGAAFVPLAAIVAVRGSAREIAARVAAVTALVIVMTQLIVAGAGPYLPPPLRDVLRPSSRTTVSFSRRIVAAVGVIDTARETFDRYRAAGTRIRAGGVVVNKERAAAHPPPKAQTTVTPEKPRPEPSKAVVAAPPKPGSKPQPPTELPRSVPVRPSVPKTEIAKSAPPPRSAPQPAISELAEQSPDPMPESTSGRLLSGFAALLLPRTVAVRLGLVSIGGGRGLWWFAEADTLLFDLMMVVTAALLVAALRRGAWRDSFVWYLILASAGISVALAYAVSNYGTLFRHREMLVATVALLSLAFGRRLGQSETSDEQSASAAVTLDSGAAEHP